MIFLSGNQNAFHEKKTVFDIDSSSKSFKIMSLNNALELSKKYGLK